MSDTDAFTRAVGERLNGTGAPNPAAQVSQAVIDRMSGKVAEPVEAPEAEPQATHPALRALARMGPQKADVVKAEALVDRIEKRPDPKEAAQSNAVIERLQARRAQPQPVVEQPPIVEPPAPVIVPSDPKEVARSSEVVTRLNAKRAPPPLPEPKPAIVEAAEAAQSAPPPAPSPKDPMLEMFTRMDSTQREVAKAMASMAEAMKLLAAPRRVVRDEFGKFSRYEVDSK